MSGFADFAELAALVVDYGHAPQLLERCQSVFIPFASLRLGRDLRSSANEAVAVLDGSALGDPMPVPDDFGSIRSITPQDSRRIALRSRDEVAITIAPKQGDRALFYNIRNRAITVRPFRGVNYDFSYHTVPVLDATTTTNEVLASYPMLYLYAALLELHTFRQDGNQRQTALQTYLDEVALINKQQSRARANAPAAVGV
jgi:hypothetical protein